MYDICMFFVSFCSVSTNVPHQPCCSSIWDAQLLQRYSSVCFVLEWMLSTSLWLNVLQCQGGFQLPWEACPPDVPQRHEDFGGRSPDHRGDDGRTSWTQKDPRIGRICSQRWNVCHTSGWKSPEIPRSCAGLEWRKRRERNCWIVGQSSISRYIFFGVGLDSLLKYVECPVWHLHKLEWIASLSSLRGLVMFGPLWSFRLSMKQFALRRLVFFSSTTYYLLSIGPKQLFGLWTSVLLEK